MWKYSFSNLCFVILLITLLALQHSVAVFGPAVHSGALNDSDHSRGFDSSPGMFARAAVFLHDSWRRGMIFRQWLLEYNVSQWQIFSASNSAETDLLEARFHVANAEVLGVAMRENDRAVKELGFAETSLDAVQTLVASTLGARLNAIKDEISAAEIREQSGPVLATAPFETIKTDLDHLIVAVHDSKTSESLNHPPARG